MTWIRDWARRQLAGIVALGLITVVFVVAHTPEASGAQRQEMARAYRFTPLSIALPGGYPQQSIRKVNQDYRHIAAWISSVGAGVAMNDIDGDGLENDLCVTDPRIDRVVVSPAPDIRSGRYAAFALDPAPLPMNRHIAPMGCVPGDYDEDGRTDLLVYWWGRSPVLYLARPGRTGMSAAGYRPVEVIPPRTSTGGEYAGAQWNTNTVSLADFDGDGHTDIYVGNYFPDSPVLDDTVRGGVTMNQSMSHALNGGLDHILRWNGTAPDGTPAYSDVPGVFDHGVSAGWTLAAAAQDLDGDQLPELYVANDFGPDRLLHNRSTPGHISLALAVSDESRAFVPKSKRLGNDSFKGMGVDFGDLNQDGLYDMFVGNITTSFGIQESNFAFVNTARDPADLHRQLAAGHAPWHDRSSQLNLAWNGWSWDVKIADFTNRGVPDVVQTSGFVKGTVNRWAQLQEAATENDTLLSHPAAWPHVQAGDDIAGGQHLRFHARGADGTYTDLSRELGLAVPVPTRGIALGDADGDGRLDMAVARQWDAPVFYHNDSPSAGTALNLRLVREGSSGDAGRPGTPVIGASVTVTTPDHRTLLGRVDGGSGHSGRRGFDVAVGLGHVDGPVAVRIDWRDTGGSVRHQQLQLAPGRHVLALGTQAREMTS